MSGFGRDLLSRAGCIRRKAIGVSVRVTSCRTGIDFRQRTTGSLLTKLFPMSIQSLTGLRGAVLVPTSAPRLV